MSMSLFAVKTEDGRKGQDGQPSVGPVYRNPLAKDGFPPLDPELSTTWDVFRYDPVPTLLIIISCTLVLVQNLLLSMLSSFNRYMSKNILED